MISVCIPTKNAASTLQATLDSTRSFPEVILLDTGSQDATLAIARTYPNVQVFETSFQGFGKLRNEAARLASHDWILALDSDEVLSPPLLVHLASLPLNPPCAYSFPRHNFYNGKWIKGCGWYPDRVVRLYHRGKTAFSQALVHESLVLKGIRVIPLPSPLLHTPYRTTADFLAKMQHYSTLFAEEHREKSSSFSRAFAHALFAFLKSYLFKWGVLLGKEGFLISLYNANTTFYKYLKLAEKGKALYGEEKGERL